MIKTDSKIVPSVSGSSGFSDFAQLNKRPLVMQTTAENSSPKKRKTSSSGLGASGQQTSPVMFQQDQHSPAGMGSSDNTGTAPLPGNNPTAGSGDGGGDDDDYDDDYDYDDVDDDYDDVDDDYDDDDDSAVIIVGEEPLKIAISKT